MCAVNVCCPVVIGPRGFARPAVACLTCTGVTSFGSLVSGKAVMMRCFDCPLCEWQMGHSYYPGRRSVRLFCGHCHLCVEMHFDRNDPEGWPVSARMELERVRRRLWGDAPVSFEQFTLPTLTNNGVAG